MDAIALAAWAPRARQLLPGLLASATVGLKLIVLMVGETAFLAALVLGGLRFLH